jgi:uncharacterized membrane protein YkvA (DUF1232 family)
MAFPEEPRPKKPIPYRLSLFLRLANYLKLFLRLYLDRRVSFWLKLIPLVALLYAISPLDWFIPVVDDLVIACLAVYLFVELCPSEIVAEHRKAIETVLEGRWRDAPDEPPIAEEEIMEGEFHEEP